MSNEHVTDGSHDKKTLSSSWSKIKLGDSSVISLTLQPTYTLAIKQNVQK